MVKLFESFVRPLMSLHLARQFIVRASYGTYPSILNAERERGWHSFRNYRWKKKWKLNVSCDPDGRGKLESMLLFVKHSRDPREKREARNKKGDESWFLNITPGEKRN